MNAPRIAKFIRRCGLAVCKLAKPFTPTSEEAKFFRKLISEVDWHTKLQDKTDREIGKIAARIFGFEYGTQEEALISELVDRMMRSTAGANRLDGHGNRLIGISPGCVLVFRMLPNLYCDQCRNIGYVCEKSHLCLHCLGIKVSVEVRREKLTGTLRARNAGLLAEIRDKLRTFQPKK